MAEDDRNNHREGWQLPFGRLAIGGVLTPVVLGVAVLIGGAVYDHTLRAKVAYSVTPQPAPGLEAAIHAGATDFEVPSPIVLPDRSIERAKAETAAQGLPGWPRSGS